MNLLGVAVKLASAVDQPLELDKTRCVRAKDRLAECDRCIRHCPVDALRTDSPIELDETRCAKCGLCLHDCPVGAFAGSDGTDAFLQFLMRYPAGRTIEIACSQHPVPELGESPLSNVVQSDRCLAALGPSIYAWLMARGMSQVVVRLDACAECEIGKSRQPMTEDLNALQGLFNTSTERRIVILQDRDANWQEREVQSIKNVPLSRRELLHWVTQDAPKTAARALASESKEDSKSKTPPQERVRLIEALSKARTLNRDARVGGLGAFLLAADEKCNACGACARACPTGAMKFSVAEQGQYRLELLVNACTDCGICLDMCEPSALHRDRAPSAAEFVAAEPLTLRSGGLNDCSRCGARFADHLEGTLCSICAYRQKNPFGSYISPAMAARLKSKREAAR